MDYGDSGPLPEFSRLENPFAQVRLIRILESNESSPHYPQPVQNQPALSMTRLANPVWIGG